MIKIHYHSDCPFFAGCENMLANMLNSDELKSRYKVSFSYRSSLEYTQGFKKRVVTDFPLYPISFPDLSSCLQLPDRVPFFIKRVTLQLFQWLLSPLLLVYEIVVLFALFKKNMPDVLHINNGGYPAALSCRAAAIAGKLSGVPKVIMVVNNLALDYRHSSRWFDYPIDRLLVRCVDLFVTGSKAASERLRTVLKLNSRNVTAIHNGIAMRSSTATLSATRERLGLGEFKGVIFGVVALLISRKGHKVLLDALVQLVLQNRIQDGEVKILIEGDGPLLDELLDFAKKHDLMRFVMFAGKEKNIVDFMSLLDVLLLPSVEDEDFPNVILEAMALGKPVIASRLAGTPEQVIDSVTGLLVEPRHIGQLADAIFYLKERPELRAQMGKAAAVRFTSHFTDRSAVHNYMNKYQELVNNVND